MLSRSVGRATVIALPDAEGLFFQPRAEAFPTASGEPWRLADERHPATVTAGRPARHAAPEYTIRSAVVLLRVGCRG